MRHPILSRRDAIGASLCVAASSGMVGLGALYAGGAIPAWLCVVGCAWLASVLHEIEHDLIHRLYFRSRTAAHDAMMLAVWLFRGNVPHGWYRRSIHLHHHRASGTKTDVEERLLGLGEPWGFRRLAIAVDGTAAFLLGARKLAREVPGFDRWALVRASLPVYPVFVGVLVWFVLHHALGALSAAGWISYAPPAALLAANPVVDVLAVAWVLPNYLRQAALSIVSSNVHYYEDVRGVHEETQVLRPIYLWPLQLFCFGFGATHALHHYVVEQPFYVRQLLAPRALPVLRRYGVRFNDTGTFRRANRFAPA